MARKLLFLQTSSLRRKKCVEAAPQPRNQFKRASLFQTGEEVNEIYGQFDTGSYSEKFLDFYEEMR